MRRWAAAVVLFALVPGLSAAQSLGELARKEKERRKKNQEQGVKARSITDQEVPATSDTSPPAGDSSAKEAPSASTAPAASEKAARPQLSEQEWRFRVSEARSRVQKARERLDTLSELHLVPGMQYVDEKGKPLITSVGQLQGLVEEARAELAAAEKALADLLEQARRAGVPPGWLR